MMTHIWNLKYDMNLSTNKKDSQTQRADHGLPEGVWRMEWSLGLGRGKLLNRMNKNKVLMQSTRNYIHPMINYNNRNIKRMHIYE